MDINGRAYEVKCCRALNSGLESGLNFLAMFGNQKFEGILAYFNFAKKNDFPKVFSQIFFCTKNHAF